MVGFVNHYDYFSILMWKMFEGDFFDCGDDACDGPGPPPKFHLPPPPRPPFMQDLNAVLGTTIECSEDGLFDLDVCAAIPVSFTFNLFPSMSLQCKNSISYHVHSYGLFQPVPNIYNSNVGNDETRIPVDFQPKFGFNSH